MWGPVSVGARRGTRLSSLVMATGEVAERQVAAAASATLRLQRYGPRHRSSNKAATLRRRSSQLGAPRELVRTHRAMRSHHRPRASSATSSVPLGSVCTRYRLPSRALSATVGPSFSLPQTPLFRCRNRSKWC